MEHEARVIKLKKYPNIECRYFQSNTSRVFINNVKPHHTVLNGARRLQNNEKKWNYGKNSEIYVNDADSPSDYVSTGLIGEIAQDCDNDTDVILNNLYGDHNIISLDKTVSHRACDMSYATLRSRTVPKTSYRQVRLKNHNHNDRNSQLSDTCNEDYIYNVLQRNERLQKLLRKLVAERQREKRREAWNNYINELKNKHNYYGNEITRLSPNTRVKEKNISNIIEDYYNTKYSEQTEPTRSLLDDFYGACKELQPNNPYRYTYIGDNMRQPAPVKYHTPQARHDRYNYSPSRDSFMILNREKKYNHFKPESRNTTFCTATNVTGRYLNKVNTPLINDINCDTNVRDFKDSIKQDIQVQTNLNFLNFYNMEKVEEEPIQKEKYTKEMQNNLTLKEITSAKAENMRMKPLQNIEQKLDILINSFNLFVKELHVKETCNVIGKPDKVSSLLHRTSKSESSRVHEADQILYTTVLHKPSRNFTISEVVSGSSTLQLRESSTSIIDKRMENEKEKTKIFKDIEELIYSRYNKPCSVEVSFDLPRSDMSTVTTSLSKAQIIEEINGSMIRSKENTEKCIAINSDPLGLLSLLRVSAEAVRQFVSYLSKLDCSSYLTQLYLPVPPKVCLPPYMCNICGASFNRPSQLSDHIQQHDLGRTRDCCVCRAILDQAEPASLFPCKYCGQRFSRAYCCELHQQACARRMGLRHDVPPMLTLLK